jgi:hypothetical protein
MANLNEFTVNWRYMDGLKKGFLTIGKQSRVNAYNRCRG